MLRGYATRKEGLTTFIKPDSAYYHDTDLNLTFLFPFTYSDGLLDISYDGNRFKEEMVDTLNQSPNEFEDEEDEIRYEISTAIRMAGGPQLVSSLGENFKAYIRAWRDGTIDAGSPISIYIAPQVIRVQEADLNYIDASSDEYLISSQPPSGNAYVTGNTVNRYRTTYVFKTPMTITIVESGVVQYITLRTILDQE
jgi:hypothetical protein